MSPMKQQIENPRCSACGDEMELTVLPPFGSPHGLKVFTCPKCGRSEDYLGTSPSQAAQSGFVAATSGVGKFWSCHDGEDNIPSPSRHPEPQLRFGGAFSLEILQVAARHSVPALTDLPASASWWPQNNAGTDKVSCPTFG